MLKLSISQRLLFFFIVNMAVLVIIIGNSYSFTHSSEKSLKTIEKKTLPVSSIYTDNLYLLESIKSSFVDATITNEKEFLEQTLDLKVRIEKNFISLEKYSIDTQEHEKIFLDYFDFAYNFSSSVLNHKELDLTDAQTLQNFWNNAIILFKTSDKVYKENLSKSLQKVSNDTSSFFTYSLALSGFGLAIIAIFGSYIYRIVKYRFKNILLYVANLTKEEPDFSIRIHSNHVDEIDELIELFNKLSERLEKEHNKRSTLLLNEIEETQKEVVFTMGSIGETRSRETGNHVKRVAEYSKILALHYGLSESEAEMLKQASPMHDIGKVGIPDSVLNKPGRFNEEERKIMDQHVVIGYDMLKHSKRPLLQAAAIVALEHHEKYDGTGYPNAKIGEDIHIFGRITALADVFDALGSDRVYKKAWDDDRIFTLFREERGKHFDPKLIDIFFEYLDEFKKIRNTFKD